MDKNLDRHMRMSPQLLEVVADDPEALAKVHRVQRAVLSDKLVRQLMNDEAASPSAMAATIEALRKAEQAGTTSQSGSGSSFSFSIVLPNSGQTLGIAKPAIEGEIIE